MLTNPLRSARAGVFASVSVGVSAAGHASASEHQLSVLALILGFAALYVCGWGFAGRERGLGAITGWMVWGQLALHVLFSLTESAPTHVHDGSVPDASSGHAGLDMLAMHVIAALVSGWWLRCGEAGLFRLLRLLGTALFALLALVALLGPIEIHRTPRRAAPTLRPRPRGTDRLLRYTQILRGPPFVLAA